MEREGAARSAYLDHACASDPELRTEVMRILRGHAGFDPMFDSIRGAQSSGTVRAAAGGSAQRKELDNPSVRRRKGVFVSRLPDELLERGARRLVLLVLVYAAGFVAAYVTRELTVHVIGDSPYRQAPHTAGQLVALTFVLLSLLVSGVLARRQMGAARVVKLGLGFEVVGSLGIALASYSGVWDLGHSAWGVSWLSVWIMMFPLLIPASPGPAALAAFASACMGPLAIALWSLTRHGNWPPMYIVLETTVPNYVCAVLAWIGSQHIHRIGLELRVSRRLGHYRLVSPLGSGGMGEVWIAEHDMLARPAALKLVRHDLADRPQGLNATLELFEREAQTTAALTSPHTVRLFDFGLTDDEVFYYVMELLEGLDLERLVRQYGPVPASRAAYLLRQACASLAEAHEAGLVHRDIKPSNLIVCRQGLERDFIKVLDFGIAVPRHTTGARQEAFHRSPEGEGGGLMGTPAFMAPEVMRGEAEPRSDLYALGCVAYWLVTGHQVFEASDIGDVVRRHRDEQPLPPSERTELDVPGAFDAVVLACLEKDPERRPANAAELASRLAAIPGPPWGQQQAREWWQEREISAEPS